MSLQLLHHKVFILFFFNCLFRFHFSYVLTYVLRVKFKLTLQFSLHINSLIGVNHLIVFETNQFLPFSRPLAMFACRFFSLFSPIPPFPSCGGCHVFASSLSFRFDSYLVISVSSVRASYEKRGRTGMRTFDPSERIHRSRVFFPKTTVPWLHHKVRSEF